MARRATYSDCCYLAAISSLATFGPIGTSLRASDQSATHRATSSVRVCYTGPCGVEQWPARWAHNPKVSGSNPFPATTFFTACGTLCVRLVQQHVMAQTAASLFAERHAPIACALFLPHISVDPEAARRRGPYRVRSARRWRPRQRTAGPGGLSCPPSARAPRWASTGGEEAAQDDPKAKPLRL